MEHCIVDKELGIPVYSKVEDAVNDFRRQAENWPRTITVCIEKEALGSCKIAPGEPPWYAFRYEAIFADAADGPLDMLWHYGISSAGEPGGDAKSAQEDGVDYYILIYYSPIGNDEVQEMDDAAGKILDSLGVWEMTDVEKTAAVYGWFTGNVKYSEGDSHNIAQSAYGAIVNRYAVCAGFGLGFCRMMRMAGVETRFISGPASKNGGVHAWNIVKLGDLYYNLDATWDSPQPKRYRYFLTNERTFSEDGTSHFRGPLFTTPEFLSRFPVSEENYFHEGVAGFQYRISDTHFAGFRADAADNQLSLSWSSVKGAENYILEVYVPSGTWHPQSPRTSLAWLIPSPNGELRGLRLRTDTGVVSDELYVVPSGTDAVSDCSAYPSIPWLAYGESTEAGTVSLRWIGFGDAERYFVYLSEDEGQTYRKVMAASAPKAAVTGLTPGSRYRFAVTARGADGKETALADSNYMDILVL